ncbi:hypothetical protein [Corynebacterium pseudodiphtheriticum]|uniref:hypothetical protein n=1 Tax=Corynebacterium pseudodiphtheriticum TaxID=37637 RepID=UPI0020BFD09C|nr:hypothetical protein [Corynebacterium pseudodiphtheriticum]UQV53640.1 hypothetical protein L2D23_07735 [Corynebacterium pseudodiphtheriticum]
MQEKKNSAAVGWGIEVSPDSVSPAIRERYTQMVADAPEWNVQLVDFYSDNRYTQTDICTVFWRSESVKSGVFFERDTTQHSKIDPVSAGQSIRTISGQNVLRAGRLAGLKGQPAWPSEKCVESSCKDDVLDSGSPAGVRFGDLGTVRAMNDGQRRLVVGFDSEFCYRSDGSRVILSYQFCWCDPLSGDLFEVVICPMEQQRVGRDSALFVCALVGEWSRYANGFRDPNELGTSTMHARGVRYNDVKSENGMFDTVKNVFKKNSVKIVLAGHYLNADLTSFRRETKKHKDLLRHVISAGGGLVSLQPIRVVHDCGRGNGRRLFPFSVEIRDTMAQVSPDHKSLAAMGEVVGVRKLDVGDSISEMDKLMNDDLSLFLEYGINDSRIVVEYLSMVWGSNIVPPVTISSGGARAARAGVMAYWGLNPNDSEDVALFRIRFQGLIQKTEARAEESDDGLSYYATRDLAPVDGDANQVLSACAAGYHGGWNACLNVGYHPGETFDHDLQSAYPTAMASVMDVNFSVGCIAEVVKDRDLTLDDFEEFGFVTPFIGYVSWEFPEDVEPCLPVREGDSILFPRTSVGAGGEQGDDVGSFEGFHGAWCFGPEVFLALKLGARVTCQIGYVLDVMRVDGVPSLSLRHAMRQMVIDRATAKREFGKKSLEELTIKVATNSIYGKTAQDVAEQHGWNSWNQKMDSVGGSAITSPYHAGMTTSLVRASLLASANEVEILSATTDGVISREPLLEHLELYGIADVLRDSREALTGDSTVWEVKHQQTDLLNFSTRANASLEPGGVLAKGGLKTPKQLSAEV